MLSRFELPIEQLKFQFEPLVKKFQLDKFYFQAMITFQNPFQSRNWGSEKRK